VRASWPKSSKTTSSSKSTGKQPFPLLFITYNKAVDHLDDVEFPAHLGEVVAGVRGVPIARGPSWPWSSIWNAPSSQPGRCADPRFHLQHRTVPRDFTTSQESVMGN